ncbi:MAG: mechanosensitive ion channel family protein [Candidatus Izimaplasma sp.]|nr:mechanosensitive ion channel family protein [Candidatus Izimaplasma bacterium]
MIDLRTIFVDFFVNYNVAEKLSHVLVSIIFIIIYIIMGFFGHKIIVFLLEKSIKRNHSERRTETLLRLLSKIVKYVVYFLVIALILNEFNVNITPILASAGILGLALGFGAQEIVRDFISGFLIILEGSVNVGDTVSIGDFKGKVIDIGIRTTIIQNWTGQHKIINNGLIDSIINFSKDNSTAVVDFGVAYDTDLLKLQELMVKFIEEIDGKYEVVTETPQFLGVSELADSSINLKIIAKTISNEHFSVERNIRRDLVVFFNKNDIEIPFPQVVVHNAKD